VTLLIYDVALKNMVSKPHERYAIKEWSKIAKFITQSHNHTTTQSFGTQEMPRCKTVLMVCTCVSLCSSQNWTARWIPIMCCLQDPLFKMDDLNYRALCRLQKTYTNSRICWPALCVCTGHRTWMACPLPKQNLYRTAEYVGQRCVCVYWTQDLDGISVA
jgi:hypothetical protein